MIDFSISTITVKNFRGMRNFKIDIATGKLTAIIGQNNSGKSNLLEAMVLCLTPKEFSSYQIKEMDFWHNKNGMATEFFDIEAKFLATSGAKLPMLRDNSGQLVEVRGIKFFAEIDNLESEQYLIDNKGERIFWGRTYAKTKDIEQWLPEIWFLSPDTLEKDYAEWKNGHIGKLLKNYKEEFLSEAATDLIKEYKKLCKDGLKTKYWIEKIEPRLRKEMAFFAGSKERPVIEPGLKDLDAWFWDGLLMNIVPEEEWPLTSHLQLGKGWQSLLRLVALNGARKTTEKNKKVWLCIDEPEAYLTPFKQRKLRQYLLAMTKKKDQVIMATHSNQMISDQGKQKIIRLNMTKNGVEKNEFEGKVPEKILSNNSEVLFGLNVVFDLTKESEKWDQLIDWDDSEAVLIKCDDINEVQKEAVFLQSLGIKWCVITNNDQELEIMEKQQSLYDKIVDKRKTNEIDKVVQTWLENEWQGKETLNLK